MNDTYIDNPIVMVCKVDPMQWWEMEAERLGEEHDPKKLIDACGVLPHWVAEWCFIEGEKPSLKFWLDSRYKFGLYHMDKAEISVNGTYTYPEDEPLFPMIAINTGEGMFFQYQYAIVAIPTPDGHYVTRMD